MREALRWLGPAGVLLALVVGFVWLLGGSAARGTFADAGSTYRAAPDGARGLYLLASAAGLPVERRHLDLEVLEPGGALVLLDVDGGASCGDEDGTEATPLFGTRGRLSSHECAAVREWVASGGRLVHVTRADDALLRTFGIRWEDGPGAPAGVAAPQGTVADAHDGPANGDADPAEDTDAADEDDDQAAEDPADADDADKKDPVLIRRSEDGQVVPAGPVHTLVPGQPTPLARGVASVVTPVAGHLRTEDGAEVAVLVDDRSGDTVALAVPWEAGWVVAVAAPDLALNRALQDADNARFWLSLLTDMAQGETVVFDERHHGHAAGRTLMGYAASRGLLPALAQILIVLVAAVLASRRFGRPVPVTRERPRTSTDYLAAMSRLYQVGGHGAHAGARIVGRVHEAVGRTGVRPEVAAALDALRRAQGRLQADAVAGRDTAPGLHEVARHAAAVYDSLSTARRRRRSGGRKWKQKP